MSDQNKPNLTLEPDLAETKTPTLVLSEPEKTPQAVEAAVEEGKKVVEPVMLDESQLTKQELEVVNEFSKKIDVMDSNMILQYGAAAQKNIADFSTSALENVRTKDLDSAGDALAKLVVQLKGFTTDENDKGFLGIFKKAAAQIATIKEKYDKAESNVQEIISMLESHQVQLLKDIAMLDKMYEQNLLYFKELTMYILAGKKRIKELEGTLLKDARDKATKSGLAEDAQAANDIANMILRFEKKLHDLELSRIISIQMSPQIRLLQNNDSLMVEKIQSSLVNTIPLWKNQMVLSLGLAHSEQAMKAQRAVTDVTNKMLKENADKLKQGSIDVAQESERGVVDMETLKHTNASLISTLEEVLKIQSEGSARRRQAEIEIAQIEGELKQKLLELRK